MGFLRSKPFSILAVLFAFTLIILACLTVQRACYDQIGSLTYSKIIDDGWCSDECGDDRAIKKVAYQGTTTFDSITNELGLSSTTANLKRVLRCPWQRNTNRIFLSFATLLCLWVILELTLGVRGKLSLVLNILLVLVVGLGIPTAAYQMKDLHYTDCARDVYGVTAASGMIYTDCYFSLFNVSFILTILTMITLLLQLILNVLNRNKVSEPTYKGVPQSAATEHVQPSAVDRADNRIN